MKIDAPFLKRVAVVYGVLIVLAWVPISTYASNDMVWSVIVAGVLSLLNLISGYLAIEYSFGKSHTTFLKVILGGTGARLLLMAGIVALLIGYFKFEAVSLIVTLLVLYMVNLSLEIHFLQKRVSLK